MRDAPADEPNRWTRSRRARVAVTRRRVVDGSPAPGRGMRVRQVDRPAVSMRVDEARVRV